MKKKILMILCVVLSFAIVVASVIYVKRDKIVSQQVTTTESTVAETIEETTEETSTIPETTVETETTTEKVTNPVEVPVSADSPELEELVKKVAKKYGAKAIQVATIKDGQVSATAQYGWAVVNKRPIEADTKMRIASLSKTPLTMVVFKLVEEGLLDIDADISDYLGVTVRHPSYPDIPITLRMLLTHTSGLSDKGYQNSLAKIQQHLKTAAAYQEKPGQIYRYNNYGFGLAATICECVTSKSVNNLIKEYFFIPMGIEASYLAGQLNSEKLAVIYNDKGVAELSIERQLRAKTDNNKIGGYMMLYAGGLTISASDLAKLMTLFVNDGVYNGLQLLSVESVTQMQTPQLPKNGVQCMPIKRKKGLFNQEYMYYHTGNAYGTYSLYAYNPDSNIGVIVITTGAKLAKDSFGVYAVCGDIANEIINKNLL